MKTFCAGFWTATVLTVATLPTSASPAATLTDGTHTASIFVGDDGPLRTYELATTAPLRDGRPADKKIQFSESSAHAVVRSGNLMFDGLYAMAVNEALLNSVPEIKDGAYGHGAPIKLDAFQTGEFWTYVWTRDLSYSVYLGLAQFDPPRAVRSLLFKTSAVKPAIPGGYRGQIIQDTGSGGSYPVSSDRVVWALGVSKALDFLPGDDREKFLQKAYPILRDTIEQDRKLVFDPGDGLYRGEQSLLDWREQTYPGWTATNVLAIAMSKALSVNVLDYYLLKTAAEYAGQLGHPKEQQRYAKWAAQLKSAINAKFFDPAAGLYATYLLSDGVTEIRPARYDLLGESLAILLDVADPSQAAAIIKNYPVGVHGPPVVWPEERSVPIYHNQAIWPFVTAFWTKAAQQANCPAAVNLGFDSLTKLAALNLSNMENYDFRSGLAEVKGRQRNGPVINSKRQLWSVAGYLSLVQDVIFGLQTSAKGLRFQPYVTEHIRNDTFSGSDLVELKHFVCQGKTVNVRLHLPAKNSSTEGVCVVQRVELNGKRLGNSFVAWNELQLENQWDIFLAAPETSSEPAALHLVDVKNERALFAPLQPTWDASQNGGITLENGRLVLHFEEADAADVTFNIYRDGALCAHSVRQTNWMDPDSGDFKERAHSYSVAAVDAVSGNESHPTPPRVYGAGLASLVIPAREMKNDGGNLVAGHHFENWGKSGDMLMTKPVEVSQSGRYAVRAEFSNGMGPVNTGITCGVKRLELREAGSGKVVSAGYLIMPQSGDWKRWDISSPVLANLAAGKNYVISISEDAVSRDMSYLKKNEPYTAHPGGGPDDCNYVNIAQIELEKIANSSVMAAESGDLSCACAKTTR